MSCCLCYPEHIGAVAAYLVLNKIVIKDWAKQGDSSTVTHVAEMLAVQNIRSVSSRYPNDHSGFRPGAQMRDCELVAESARCAASYLNVFPRLTEMELFKMAVCMSVQSEYFGDSTSPARAQLTLMESCLIFRLGMTKKQAYAHMSYERAPWKYKGEKDVVVPEIVISSPVTLDIPEHAFS